VPADGFTLPGAWLAELRSRLPFPQAVALLRPSVQGGARAPLSHPATRAPTWSAEQGPSLQVCGWETASQQGPSFSVHWELFTFTCLSAATPFSPGRREAHAQTTSHPDAPTTLRASRFYMDTVGQAFQPVLH